MLPQVNNFILELLCFLYFLNFSIPGSTIDILRDLILNFSDKSFFVLREVTIK